MDAKYPSHQSNICRVAFLLGVLCLIAMLLAGCGAKEAPEMEVKKLSVSSSAFQDSDKIPAKYTCSVQDVSPPLSWSEPSSGVRSFVLIVDDPDALGGTFTHWIIFNIPSNSRGLPEAVPTQAQLSDGTTQGKNDFGRIGYSGPCPPPGHPHRYQFTLYALDQALDLKAGASKRQVLDAMREHILAQGQLTGTYQR